MTLRPGDVVIARFPGAEVTKVRPAVVLSTPEYHSERPDLIVGQITSQIDRADTSFDYILQDWRAARLNVPSAFRSNIATVVRQYARRIGRLSDTDWEQIRRRLVRATAFD